MPDLNKNNKNDLLENLEYFLQIIIPYALLLAGVTCMILPLVMKDPENKQYAYNTGLTLTGMGAIKAPATLGSRHSSSKSNDDESTDN